METLLSLSIVISSLRRNFR